MKVLVLTVSDRASQGIYKDLSGPEVERVILAAGLPDITVNRQIVSDDYDKILQVFGNNTECDFIITTGGTGLSKRDVTPEATEFFCDRMIPGIAEILRSESYKQTPHAMLSRAAAGIKGKTVIINLPGSVKGAVFCTDLIIPVLKHAPEMIRGGKH